MKTRNQYTLHVKLLGLLLAIGLIATGCKGCTWFKGKGQEGGPLVVTPLHPDGPDDNVEKNGPTDVTTTRPPDRPADVEKALKTVYFDFDSSALTPQTKEALDANVEWVKANADVPILIEGHCDERGTLEYNLALGQRRAKGVKDYFLLKGVSSERLYTISYGEERPVDPGWGEVHWMKNRRAEFKRYN